MDPSFMAETFLTLVTGVPLTLKIAFLSIALGSVIGGQIGAGVGRRLPVDGLRAVIVIVGLVAAGVLFARYW